MSHIVKVVLMGEFRLIFLVILLAFALGGFDAKSVSLFLEETPSQNIFYHQQRQPIPEAVEKHSSGTFFEMSEREQIRPLFTNEQRVFVLMHAFDKDMASKSKMYIDIRDAIGQRKVQMFGENPYMIVPYVPYWKNFLRTNETYSKIGTMYPASSQNVPVEERIPWLKDSPEDFLFDTLSFSPLQRYYSDAPGGHFSNTKSSNEADVLKIVLGVRELLGEIKSQVDQSDIARVDSDPVRTFLSQTNEVLGNVLIDFPANGEGRALPTGSQRTPNAIYLYSPKRIEAGPPHSSSNLMQIYPTKDKYFRAFYNQIKDKFTSLNGELKGEEIQFNQGYKSNFMFQEDTGRF